MKESPVLSLRLVFGLALGLALMIMYIPHAIAAAEIYVDPGGSIQTTIDNAENGAVIVIRPATYKENLNFKNKAITVRSMDPDNPAVVAATIIDGNQAGSVVTFSSGEGSGSVLSGVTIQNGSAKYGVVVYGGGIYCHSSSPIITKCTITGNSAYSGGGGIFSDASSSPTITNCIISRNETGTSGSGGGIACRSSTRINNCTISNNKASSCGGGISCSDFSTITNCTISRNEAGSEGGGISCSGSSSFTNCIISQNMSMKWIMGGGVGGGISCSNSLPSFTNCTISRNKADMRGGGIYCSCSVVTLTNCILWDNLPQKIYLSSSSICNVTNSDIQQESGLYAGDGNINADPLFVCSEQGNFYLRAGSPCIDHGIVTGAPSYDHGGISRPQGLGTDIGAYEYVEPASCTPRASFTVDQTTGVASSIGVLPLNVHFDASSSGGIQYPGATFLWDFGDGFSSSSMPATYAYPYYGVYSVSLTRVFWIFHLMSLLSYSYRLYYKLISCN